MITYQLETWKEYYKDAPPLWERHYAEVAVNAEALPLQFDVDQYANLYNNGFLQIATARDGEELIGYHTALIARHLHYSILSGFGDLHYLIPERRASRVGLTLLKAAEVFMIEAGVEHIVTSTRIAHNKTKIFERMGYTPTDISLAKTIKEVRICQ